MEMSRITTTRIRKTIAITVVFLIACVGRSKHTNKRTNVKGKKHQKLTEIQGKRMNIMFLCIFIAKPFARSSKDRDQERHYTLFCVVFGQATGNGNTSALDAPVWRARCGGWQGLTTVWYADDNVWHHRFVLAPARHGRYTVPTLTKAADQLELVLESFTSSVARPSQTTLTVEGLWPKKDDGRCNLSSGLASDSASKWCSGR